VRAYRVGRRLWFGSAIRTWQDVERLEALGITHIINLRKNKHGKKLRQFKCLRLRFRDDKQPRPRWFYRDAIRFYRQALDSSKPRVFVMCRHGICRSASLAYFLLRASGYGPTRARAIVLRARPSAILCRAYRESGERFLTKQSRRGRK
jgi:protein-tyrosine phosphatase